MNTIARDRQVVGTVEPRFNEVPRDWGNLFVISRVRYIENLVITNLWRNNQNVRYIEVKLKLVFSGVMLHYPAFPDLNDNICVLMSI